MKVQNNILHHIWDSVFICIIIVIIIHNLLRFWGGELEFSRTIFRLSTTSSFWLKFLSPTKKNVFGGGLWFGLCPSVRDLSVRMNISNTNEYFFPILYTCIYYNPPMNPLKFRPDQIQKGRLTTIFVCSNWQNIWKCCLSGWISPTPMNIFFRNFTHALITSLRWSLWNFVRIKFRVFTR